MTPMATPCRELFARLSEYVDGELSQEICQDIQRHLAACDPCAAVANTLRATAELCRRLPAPSLPSELADELRVLLARHPSGTAS